MTPAELLSELLAAAKGAGVEVRSRALAGARAGPGGLVRLHGRAVLVLNSAAPEVDRVAATAEALASVPLDLTGVGAEARHAIERAAARLGLPARPAPPVAADPRPGLRWCRRT